MTRRDYPAQYSEAEANILGPCTALTAAGCDQRQIHAMEEIDQRCHITSITVSTSATYRWSRVAGGRIIHPRRRIRFSAILPD